MRWRTSLLGAALGGAVLLGGILLPSVPAQARDRDDQCFQRIRNEESKLQRDIDRHGFFSRQAEHRREKIRGLRERCFLGTNHRHFRGDGDRDRDDGFFRNGRHRHHGDGDHDRDDGFFRRRHEDGDHDRDDRSGWRHGNHDRDHDDDKD